MTAYVNGAKITGTSTKVDTSGATATAADIASGKTAWVNGAMLTGSLAKGKKVNIQEKTLYNYTSTLSVSNLPFVPEGIIVVAKGPTYGNTAHTGGVISAHSIKENGSIKYSAMSFLASNYWYETADSDRRHNTTFGTNTVTLTEYDYKFVDTTYLIITWGE